MGLHTTCTRFLCRSTWEGFLDLRQERLGIDEVPSLVWLPVQDQHKRLEVVHRLDLHGIAGDLLSLPLCSRSDLQENLLQRHRRVRTSRPWLRYARRRISENTKGSHMCAHDAICVLFTSNSSDFTCDAMSAGPCPATSSENMIYFTSAYFHPHRSACMWPHVNGLHARSLMPRCVVKDGSVEPALHRSAETSLKGQRRAAAPWAAPAPEPF